MKRYKIYIPEIVSGRHERFPLADWERFVMQHASFCAREKPTVCNTMLGNSQLWNEPMVAYEIACSGDEIFADIAAEAFNVLPMLNYVVIMDRDDVRVVTSPAPNLAMVRPKGEA